MSAGTARWRALIRLAWRDTVRHKGRTTLVVALIGVPVALMFTASVFIRSNVLTIDERRQVELGPTADLIVSSNDPDRSSDKPELPAGARAVTLQQESGVRLRTQVPDGKILRLSNISGSVADPMVSGVFLLRSGTWPQRSNEVAVSKYVAQRARLTLGQSVEVSPKRTVTVTALFDKRDDLRSDAIVSVDPLTNSPSNQGRQVWIDLGPNVTATEAKPVAESLWAQGWIVSNTNLFPGSFAMGINGSTSNEPQSEATPIAIMNVAGMVALFLLGTIVTAAFAVGARRQLRTLGLIAANGGDPRQLRRLVTLQGTAAAAVGAVVGLVLGCGGLALALPHMNRLARRILPGVDMAPFDVLGAFAMALLAGSIAAGIPGRTIARVPVLNALGGRRPLRQLSNSLPVVGLATSGLGGLLLTASSRPNQIGSAWFAAAVGAIGVLLGGVIIAPWLVGQLAPLATRLGGTGRLAVRRMTRHRGRSGPIVAAIMATGAVAMGTNTLAQSADQGQRDRYEPYYALNQVGITSTLYSFGPIDRDTLAPSVSQAQLDDAVQRAADIVPDAVIARYLSSPDFHGGGGEWLRLTTPGRSFDSPDQLRIVVGNPELLTALKLPAPLIAAFNSGRAIVSGTGAAAPTMSLTATTSAPEGGEVVASREFVIDTVLAGPIDLGRRTAGSVCVENNKCTVIRPALLIVPQSVATKNQIDMTPAALLVAPTALTSDQRDLLGNARQDLVEAAEERLGSVTTMIPSLEFEVPYFAPVGLIELVIGGLALVLALGVTAVSLALTTVDNRGDDATLTSLGASPGTRRRVRSWEAALLAAMGMAMALPLGFLPAAAIVTAQGDADPIVFPWMTAGLLAIVVPAAAALLGWLTTRTPRRIPAALAADA